MPHKTLIVGNWKMNGTIEETLKLITELRHKHEDHSIEVAIAPPFTALNSAQVILQETELKLVAQNMHWETDGYFTGEVSAVFLKDVGCQYVMLVHSERRQYFHETDEFVNKKIQTALAQELIPIYCVGETLEQRQAGKAESVLESQMKRGLLGFSMMDVKDIVIAYEPVWAIGTGKTPTHEEIEAAFYWIRSFLARTYDAPTSNSVRLLYGGSVSPDNAGQILSTKHVDGLLVGGASLVMDKFLRILKSQDETN